MERSVFFNSAPGDPRTYQASDFAGYFGTVLSSGLFHTDNIPALAVHCEGTDMRTYVDAGKAAIEGYFYENTSALYLAHALPEASLDRIDRIVLRLDTRNQSRFIRLFVVQGQSSATPVAPALQRDEYIFELCLAEIRVRANTSTLVPADLVDKRLDESLCGLVYSLISLPTSQFQQEWDTFMSGLESQSPVPQTAFDAHKADYTLQIPYAVTTGPANTYAISLPIASLVAGMAITIKINIASTGPSTLNWNGSGNQGLKKSDGSNITNLKAGGVYTFRYDGVNFIVQGEGASGNAVASDLLSGKTADTDAGPIVGSMPAQAGNTSALSYNNSQTGNLWVRIPAGAYIVNGSSGTNPEIILSNPNFIPANFRKGLGAFGMTGTMQGGPEYQTGSGNVFSGTLSFNLSRGGGAVQNKYMEVVFPTPMSAAPNYIIVSGNSSGTLSIYSIVTLVSSPDGVIRVTTNTTAKDFVNGGNCYANINGFRIPAEGGDTWKAFIL